jgi:hypothetical protein
MVIKKVGSYAAGSHPIYDPQVSNRKTLCENPLSPAALLLFTWESSNMTLSQTEYTKTPPQTGGSFYFLTEKLPKTAFLDKNL